MQSIRFNSKSEANNIFEAISIGATNMIGPIGGILSNLIAFTAFFAFIDAIFIWFFGMLGLANFGVTVNYIIIFFNLISKFIELKINLKECNAIFILSIYIFNGNLIVLN